MAKQVKISEEELHGLIANKIMEALESVKETDLEYSPAIGNKKRGPGKKVEDQMTKRRNKKMDEETVRFTQSQLQDFITESVKKVLSESFDESNDEEAVSKSQQRLFGMVHDCQKNGECASKKVKDLAKSMSKKDVDDFAETKHKGLPNHVKRGSR